MRQIHYVKYNKLRRKEFQIRTVIYTEDQKKYVEKSAVLEEGKAHLERFQESFRRMNQCFCNVEALEPEAIAQGVRYPFLEGQTLDEKLAQEMLLGADIIQAVRAAMDTLFRTRKGQIQPFVKTQGFEEVFPNMPGFSDQSYAASNLDMLFENIMVCDGAYVCLDYEWVMDFPIPSGFIHYRNLYYFYRKYKQQLEKSYTLREFLQAFEIPEAKSNVYWEMEKAFQDYVHDRGNVYSYPKQYEKPIITFQDMIEEKEHLLDVIQRLNDVIAHQGEEIVNRDHVIDQRDHKIKDLNFAVELKENHIQNLNVMIADYQAALAKYGKFKKVAKVFGGKQIYHGLRKGYHGAKKLGNAILPGESKRRKFVKTCGQLIAHPRKTGGLWFGIKHGNLFVGDPVLDRLYFELGPIHFPRIKQPKVSIIIPVYNQVDYTYRCLDSIRKHTQDVDYEVIIADDVSSDGTKALGLYVQGVNFVRNTKNLGFLKNCNHAATLAKGEYLFFLNNDTQVTPGWLSSLLRLIESDPGIGMAGSKLVYPDGRLQEAGGIFWKEGFGWNYGKFDDPDKPEYNYVKDVDYISGAAILLSKKLWDQIGGFDELFAPAYCEDADLAFAVRKAGYRVVYQPQSVVVHYEGISNGTDENSGVKAYQSVNMEKLKAKWAEEFSRQYEHGEQPNPFGARERMMGRKVILVIDHYVPTFDKDAGSKSTFQYMKLFLKKGFVVKFIGDNYGHEEPYTTTLMQMGIEVLYGGWYQEHIFSWIEQNKDYIDFAYMNRPHIAVNYIDFVKKNTGIKIIYYGHDLHFLREQREYEITGDESHKKESAYMKKQELDIIRKVDMSYYPSFIERDVLHEIDPDLRVRAICLNMFETFPEVDYQYGKRSGLLFVGGFAHRPNADAVLWFAKEIFPILREKLDLTFTVVGSKAPEEIQALDGNGICVKGFVSDEELISLYAGCRLAVVPLRFGAGVKGKVIEALYYGVPTVTTSIGAEGIEGAEDVLLIQDSAEGFANQILSIYQNESFLTEKARLAQDYVKAYFSMDAVWNIIKDDFEK